MGENELCSVCSATLLAEDLFCLDCGAAVERSAAGGPSSGSELPDWPELPELKTTPDELSAILHEESSGLVGKFKHGARAMSVKRQCKAQLKILARRRQPLEAYRSTVAEQLGSAVLAAREPSAGEPSELSACRAQRERCVEARRVAAS